MTLAALSADQTTIAGVGYVPQGRAIFPALTVRQNVPVAHYAQGKTAGRIEAVIEMLRALGPHLWARGGGSSGGQQEILALGTALVGEPSVLLLDEPSEGIQQSILDEIIAILDALISKSTMSIVLVEQTLDFAVALAYRAHVIDMGRILHTWGKNELHLDRIAWDLMFAG